MVYDNHIRCFDPRLEVFASDNLELGTKPPPDRDADLESTKTI